MDDLIARLEKNSVPEIKSGCRIWTGPKTRNGNGQHYGCLCVNNKSLRAHRVAWQAKFGEIPKNTCVCHKCDTPLCINPEHLFLGSLGDNNRDRRSKKRDHWFQNRAAAIRGIEAARKIHKLKKATPKGENNGSAKLTRVDVYQIRKMRDAGYTQKSIAQRFEVGQPAVWAILAGKTWGHVK